MTLRLIIDFLMRAGRPFGASLPLLLFAWPLVSLAASAATALALSMSVAFCIGLAAQQLVTRELFMMPVSTREMWRARWWLGTVGAVVFMAVPKLVFPVRGVSFALLSMVCDLAYVGVCLSLWPLFDVKPRGPLWLRVFAVRSGMILWLLTIGGGAAVWPFVLRQGLPTEWEHLRGPAGLVLLAALALTVRGYLYAPPPGAPRGLARAGTESTDRRTSKPGRARMSTRITGVSYVLRRDAIVSAVYAALVVGGVLLLVFVEQPARGFSGSVDEAAHVLVPGPGEFFGRSAWLVMLFSCFPAGLFWRGVIRHVRTLPVSTMQVIGLLVAVPLSRWLAVWMLLAGLFAVDGRLPVTPGADTLVAFTGIAALMHAIGFGWSNRWRASVIVPLILAFWLIVALDIRVAPGIETAAGLLMLSLPGFVGLVTIAAAALLHYDTLARRSATYRPAIGRETLTPGLS